MQKLLHTYIVLLFTILLLTFVGGRNANAQNTVQKVGYPTFKALMINSFSINITYPREKQTRNFEVQFLGNDTATFNQFNLLLNISPALKEVTYQTSFIRRISEIENPHILVVDQSMNSQIEEIWEAVTSKKILLVTENCTDLKYLMLNIYVNSETNLGSFQMNRTNILLEGLNYTPDLLLSGGSDVDVRELYLSMKTDLEAANNEVEEQKVIILEQNADIELQKQIVEDLQKTINELKIRIQNEKDNLHVLEDSISTQQQILKEKLKQINIQDEKLNKSMEILKIKENLLNDRENDILIQTQKLDSLITESTKQQIIINDQKIILNSKELLIGSQQKKLLFYILLVVVLFLLVFFGLVLIRMKQNDNKTLETKVILRTTELQNEITERIKTEKELEKHKLHLEKLVEDRTVEISHINEELRNANEEQLEVNNELLNQKEELEITLQQLQETQNQLIQSEKMASLGVLTAGIAHEINNPINYISSGVEGLQTVVNEIVKIIHLHKNLTAPQTDNLTQKDSTQNIDYLVNGVQRLTKNIQTGVNRTTEIIRSLSIFTRMDEGELVLANLEDNIDSALTLLHGSFKNKIEVVKKYGKIPQIFCYPGKMNQVFINLFANAIQAIADKGTIEIETACESFKNEKDKNCRFVKIVVKDSGHGMSETVKNKIFQPFFTTKEVGKGTGLGLSITHGIIEQHKGRISVNSEINKGTEFVLLLPTNLKT